MQGWRLGDPANVKALVKAMHREALGMKDGDPFYVPGPKLKPGEGGVPNWTNRPNGKVASLWNGDVPRGNCLSNPDLPNCLDEWGFKRRDPTKLALALDSGCGYGFGAPGRKRQAGGAVCPVVVGGSSGSGSGSGSGPGFPSFISFATGAPSPTCTSGCGTLCTGYFCRPNPTGKPADQRDPKAPPVITPTPGPDEPDPTPPPLSPKSCTPPQTLTTVKQSIGEAVGLTSFCVSPPATSTPAPPPPPPKQYLAVVVERSYTQNDAGPCNENGGIPTIRDFGMQHQTEPDCEQGGGKQLARVKDTERNSFWGDYTDGYSVVAAQDGAKVRNGKGQHQRCATDTDDRPQGVRLTNCFDLCPSGLYRVLKCDGVWLDD